MPNPDSTIFISYSHKDRRYLDELLAAVKPTLEQVHGLSVWSDTDIATGQLWDDEIKGALQRARAVVLLVSNHFLGSRYIKDQELPLLLPRAQSGDLRVFMVFVSAVTAPAMKVRLHPDSDERFDLLSINGANIPETPLSEMKPAARERLFVNLADALYQHLAAPIPPRRRAEPRSERGIRLPQGADGRRPQLPIRLQRAGVTLSREFILPGRQRPYSPELPGEAAVGRLELWQPGESFDGDLLFELLFGDDEGRYQEMLAGPSNGSSPSAAGPSLHPWRIRLVVDPADDKLQALPWTHISHQGIPLADSGWSIEFTPVPPRFGPLELANHSFIMPGRVLLVFPDHKQDPIAAAHLNDLHTRLQQMWTKNPPIFVADNAAQVTAYLSEQSPRLVYWYGRAKQHEQQWRLTIDRAGDGLGPGPDLPFTELHQAFSSVPPSALFFNLIGEHAVQGFPATAELVEAPAAKFIGYQVAPMSAAIEACRAGSRWLDAVLTEDQRLDPVTALHHNDHAFAACRSSYQEWDPQIGDSQLDDEVAYLLLDRSRQRSDLLQARDDLIDLSSNLRIHCLFTAGTSGNRCADFPGLGITHLGIHPRDGVHSWLIPIELPAMELDQKQLETAYRRHFGLMPQASLFDALRPPQHGHATRQLIPILAWTLVTDPDPQQARAQRQATLPAILEWSREALTLDCPKNLRILSLVTLEIDDDDEYDALRDSAEELDERLTSGQEYRRSSSFRFEVMDRLRGVTRRDLRHYFDSEYCTCPDGLRRAYPDLLMQGRKERSFAEVVALIHQAAQGWNAMATELAKSVDP